MSYIGRMGWKKFREVVDELGPGDVVFVREPGRNEEGVVDSFHVRLLRSSGDVTDCPGCGVPYKKTFARQVACSDKCRKRINRRKERPGAIDPEYGTELTLDVDA